GLLEAVGPAGRGPVFAGLDKELTAIHHRDDPRLGLLLDQRRLHDLVRPRERAREPPGVLVGEEPDVLRSPGPAKLAGVLGYERVAPLLTGADHPVLFLVLEVDGAVDLVDVPVEVAHMVMRRRLVGELHRVYDVAVPRPVRTSSSRRDVLLAAVRPRRQGGPDDPLLHRVVDDDELGMLFAVLLGR